jgi:hypothetical protein
MNRRTLHLHIDRLVVEGLPAHSEKRFVRALEAQLTKLAIHGLQDAFRRGQARRIASIDAGVMRAGTSPEQAATQITAALRSGLAGGLAGKGAGRHA